MAPFLEYAGSFGGAGNPASMPPGVLVLGSRSTMKSSASSSSTKSSHLTRSKKHGAVSFVSGTLVPGRMSWMGCSTGGRLSGGFRSTFLKRRLDQRQQHGCHPQRHDHVAPWRPHPCLGMKCERGSNDEEDTAAVLNFCKPSSSVKDSGKGRNIILLQKGSRL